MPVAVPGAGAYMESLEEVSAIQRTDGYNLTFPKIKVLVTGSTPYRITKSAFSLRFSASRHAWFL